MILKRLEQGLFTVRFVVLIFLSFVVAMVAGHEIVEKMDEKGRAELAKLVASTILVGVDGGDPNFVPSVW